MTRQWRELRLASSEELGFLREHWSRPDLVVLWRQGWPGHRVATQLLLQALAPGPHLLLLGCHPVTASEVAAIVPEHFYVLPDDLDGRPSRDSAQIATLIREEVGATLRGPEDKSIRFSMRFVWDGRTLAWELRPGGLRYYHRSPLVFDEHVVASFFGISPSDSVSGAFFAERGLNVVPLQVRAVRGDLRFRDSPVIELDLARPATVHWDSETGVSISVDAGPGRSTP